MLSGSLRALGVLGLAFLAACGTHTADERYPTGSSTIASSEDFESVLTVNIDEGTVTKIAADGTLIEKVDVGVEPTRIARVGDEYWVTLRGERGIAILVEGQDGLEVQETLRAGNEPYGLVATRDGSKVYVTLALKNEVQEYDAKSRKMTRSWDIEGQPRWLALTPNEQVLYVASQRRGLLHRILLEDGSVEQVELPSATGFNVDRTDGFEMPGRITGDPTITPDGSLLAIPMLYVDNVTPADGEPTDVEVPSQGGYGSPQGSIGKMNPGISRIPLDKDGLPDMSGGGDDGGGGGIVFLSGSVFFDGVRDDSEAFQSVRSYPSSITASPDGLTLMVTLEGSNMVAAVGTLPFDENTFFRDDFAMEEEPFFDGETIFVSPQQAGFTQQFPISFIRTGAGPRSVAYLSEDKALVHTWLDRKLSKVNGDDVLEQLRNNGMEGFNNEMGHFSEELLRVEESVLPPDVEYGRRLFFSATLPAMATAGGGVSCATCHFDGRDDGITWQFDDGPRQTPSLVGNVDQTAPVTWTRGVESVAQEAFLTSQNRMGGHGITVEELQAVQAFVNWTRVPDVPDQDAAAIERGKAIFNRADVACATCHSGERYTDNQSYNLLGLPNVNTPGLNGIAATAPYFHDGSAPTLRSVLVYARGGGMGDTSMLSEAEMDDLEAYLKSL